MASAGGDAVTGAAVTGRWRALLGLLLVAAVLVGCGEKRERLTPAGERTVRVMLDWFPNADHAPIYAAEAAGYFRQAGLRVELRTPSDPAAPIRAVAAGRVDLAVSYEPEVFRALDQGLRVRSVAALVQRPLTSILWLERSGIRSVRDLAGKRVGYAGIDYQRAYLEAILAEAGVDPSRVRVRNVGFGLAPALLTGKVDAVIGAFWNYEAVQLRLERRRPQVVPVDRAGVPSYDELVFVANGDALDRDRAKLRAFLAAVARGERLVRRRPDFAVTALVRANRDLDPRLQRAAVRATLAAFAPPRGRPWGWQDPRSWREFGGWLKTHGILRRAPDPTEAYTNELLAGAGL
ncbi:putative hydroxymethylpyrimidine transport system substrate-binding protein [Thermoleophilum album]|uniref:Putative hydroxymethylpyrimidine transport system substrate-binding protein n=1 Tax=Thermoleophilum album TaxID=29539 RepID=A0A1H6FMR3_THEAL|nr:putative hydroxymethylpyrimidine transport system substrate-binding protein [Thermoleophilum album]